MAFTFKRDESTITDKDGKILSVDAYSGHGDGLNNPDWEVVKNSGPIPAGRYHIGRPRTPIDHLGPYAMPLTPIDGTDTHGRSGFFIHGDNARHDHSASDGCVIAGHPARYTIAGSEDDVLIVE